MLARFLALFLNRLPESAKFEGSTDVPRQQPRRSEQPPAQGLGSGGGPLQGQDLIARMHDDRDDTRPAEREPHSAASHKARRGRAPGPTLRPGMTWRPGITWRYRRHVRHGKAPVRTGSHHEHRDALPEGGSKRLLPTRQIQAFDSVGRRPQPDLGYAGAETLEHLSLIHI